MLGFLFRGLTAELPSGVRLFETLTAEARRQSWYRQGEVPDTLDGRFAVLATIIALALVRLEQDGEAGDRLSVALTERFIAVMESEHRELGLGDPTLGKTVRKLVAKLAKRTELWRSAVGGQFSWAEATCESLYKEEPKPEALDHGAAVLKQVNARLAATPLAQLEEGKFA